MKTRRSRQPAGKHTRPRAGSMLRRKGLVVAMTGVAVVAVALAATAGMATGCLGQGSQRPAAQVFPTAHAPPAAALSPASHASRASHASSAVHPVPAAYSAPRGEEITYSVRLLGDVHAELRHFASQVRTTLHDPRGWTLGGRLEFRRVDSGGDMRIVLASSAVVDEAADGCSDQYSCRVGTRVLINEHRWDHGTESWRKSLRDYHHYVINHEVGHFLGLDHRHCEKADAPAPVMQQQSINLEGCHSNVWPRLAELRAAAGRQDVPAPARSPRVSRDTEAGRQPDVSRGGPGDQRAWGGAPDYAGRATPGQGEASSAPGTDGAATTRQSDGCSGEGFLERLARLPGSVF